MPELPEVTTIVGQLKKEIVGMTIADVQAVGGYKTQVGFVEFQKKVTGQKIVCVRRLAKNIVIELHRAQDPSHSLRAQDDEFSIVNSQLSIVYLVIHLAMTGRLLLRKPGQESDPWTRLVFKLALPLAESRIKNQELRFCDARMFGFVRLMDGGELNEYAGKYGPDALDERLSPQEFLSRLKKKKTQVKRALLEQELVAGAGNIYVNDSLWLAGIHPLTRTDELGIEQVTKLLRALQEILRESIEHRGSTLGDKMYIDLYGAPGEHQKYFRVFGKGGQPCPRCGEKIESVEIGGRGTFFCPQCQKKKLADSCKNNQPSLI